MMSLFLKTVLLWYLINVVKCQSDLPDPGDKNVHFGGLKFGFRGKTFSLSQGNCPGGVFFDKPVEMDWICVDGYFIKRPSGCVSAGEEIIGAMDYICKDYNTTKETVNPSSLHFKDYHTYEKTTFSSIPAQRSLVQAFISITEKERSNEHGITFFDDKETLSNMRIYNLAWGLQKVYNSESEVGSPNVIVVNTHKTPEYQVGRYCYQGVNKMGGSAFRFSFPNENFASGNYGFMKKPCKPESIKLKFSDGERTPVLQGTPPLPDDIRFAVKETGIEPTDDPGQYDYKAANPPGKPTTESVSDPFLKDSNTPKLSTTISTTNSDPNLPGIDTVTTVATDTVVSMRKTATISTVEDSETTDFAPQLTIMDFVNSTEKIDTPPAPNPAQETDTAISPVEPLPPIDINPTDPLDGTNPIEPSDGTNPIEPPAVTDPIEPSDGTNPIEPPVVTNPIEPSDGTNPIEPIDGTNLSPPSAPLAATRPHKLTNGSIISKVNETHAITRFIYPIKLKPQVALGSHIKFLDPFLEENIDMATYILETMQNPDKPFGRPSVAGQNIIQLPVTTWWYGILKESIPVVQKLIPDTLITDAFFSDVLKTFSFMFRIIEDDDVDLMAKSDYDAIITMLQKCKTDVTEQSVNVADCPTLFQSTDGIVNGSAAKLNFGHEPPGPNKFNSKSNDVIVESMWNVVDIVYTNCFESFAEDLNKHSRMIMYLIETVFKYDRLQARWYRTPEGLSTYQALVPHGDLEVLMYNYDKLKAVSRQGHVIKDWLPKPRKVTKFHTRKQYEWQNEIATNKEAVRKQNRWIRYKQHKTVNVYQQSNKRYEKEDWTGKRYKRSVDKPKKRRSTNSVSPQLSRTVIQEWKPDLTAYCLGYVRNVKPSSGPIGLNPSIDMLESELMCSI